MTTNTTTTIRHRLLRVCVAAVLAVAVAAAAASPAAAADDNQGRSLGELRQRSGTLTDELDGGSTASRYGADATSTTSLNNGDASTTTSTTTTVPARELDGEGLEARYRSLSVGLVAAYATSTGVDLSSLLSDSQLNAAFGSTVTDGNVTSLDDLEGRLSSSGLVPGSVRGDSLASTIAAAGASPDSMSVIANINLANRLSGLATPELTVPNVGANQLTSPGMVSEAQLSASPADSLVFGLFANQSLAQFANSAPNLFAQVVASGITDPNQQAAWASARTNAAAAVSSGLGESLISPCHAAMMAAMASGNGTAATAITPAGADCSPCIAAGVYMSGQTNRLFNSGSGSPLTEDDGVISPVEWNLLPEWQRQAMGGDRVAASQRSASSNALSARSASNQCAASAAGTSGYLGNNLSGVLRNLGG
jgi:hypothetical protein